MNDTRIQASNLISLKSLETIMKRLAILFGLAVLLSGCVVAPYGPRDGGYRNGGDQHEHHDDRGDDHRRDDNPNRY
ncbi:hypothetical protein SAMN04515618_102217 [Collimonas sp. OK307]|nr:hypothetical protein SAMN04515618_102217 [Collimonas sp. OK307]